MSRMTLADWGDFWEEKQKREKEKLATGNWRKRQGKISKGLGEKEKRVLDGLVESGTESDWESNRKCVTPEGKEKGKKIFLIYEFTMNGHLGESVLYRTRSKPH